MNKLQYTTFTFIALPLFSNASLTIAMNYDLATNPYEPAGDDMVSAANQVFFDDAATFWETALTGYADGIDRTLTIHASTFEQAASGGGVLLGSAGPRALTFTTSGHWIALDGSARFNVHPDAVGGAGLLDALTIRHEMGHILGIGTLWELNGVYTDGTGQYTGENALAAYNQEFGQSRTFVPIELDGGGGTANGHWNEVTDNFGVENQPGLDANPGDEVAAPVVVRGINMGFSMDDALMTGVLSNPGFLSDTTLGSFQDIGFTTQAFNASVVPEPSSALLIGLGSLTLLMRRKK